MRVPVALALALLVASCAAAPPPVSQVIVRTDIDTAARPYSRTCIEACQGVAPCQACCALDALMKWHEASSEDAFCQASRGCTDDLGMFIYKETAQCAR